MFCTGSSSTKLCVGGDLSLCVHYGSLRQYSLMPEVYELSRCGGFMGTHSQLDLFLPRNTTRFRGQLRLLDPS